MKKSKADYEPILCHKTGMFHRLPSDLLVCNCHVCERLLGGTRQEGVIKPVFAWLPDERFRGHVRPTCERCAERRDNG